MKLLENFKLYYYSVFTYIPCIVILSEFICLPTDAQFNCLKNNFRIYSKPLNANLKHIFHLLALLGAHHILHVSRIRFKIDIKRAPKCFVVITITRERTIRFFKNYIY